MISQLLLYSTLVVLIVGSHSFVIPVDYLRRYNEDNQPHPLIMIPGDGGCQAYAQLKDYKSDPFQIWVDLRYLVTPRTFGEYFRLFYDNKTGKSVDNDKATITFPGWGETWPVDNLDSRPHSVTKYFEDITTKLKQNNSFYVSNRTLRGTPFDFRKAPNENEDFNPKLKDLIEETYRNSGNQRVVILAHSMGSLYGLNFLNQQSDSWKKKFIKAFISASGPLGGSMKALKIEASGDNFGIYFQNSLWYREVQRSMPSLAFLLPDPRLWSRDEPVIFTPEKNYTTHDYKELFSDMGYPEGYRMYVETKPIVDGFVGPTGIDEVYCVYGTGVSTPGAMIYTPPSYFDGAFPDQNPKIVVEDGDGTVNLRSLEQCLKWDGVQHQTFHGVEHLGILSDQRLIEQIMKIANVNKSPRISLLSSTRALFRFANLPWLK